MSVPHQTQDERKFTGTHMLVIMFAFFGVIIAVNITMAMMAGKTWTGLVVKNSYIASQKFNAELQDAKVQKLSGLNSNLAYSQGNLTFVLKDKGGKAQPVENLVVKIGRPAFEQQDRTLALSASSNNTYKLAINLDQGMWFIKITGESDGRPYRRDARLYVNSEDTGRLE